MKDWLYGLNWFTTSDMVVPKEDIHFLNLPWDFGNPVVDNTEHDVSEDEPNNDD